MLVAGCDVGASTAKAVVMGEGRILGFDIVSARARAVQSAYDAMDSLLRKLGLTYQDLDFCVSTGYGRKLIPFANMDVTEISCHGRGAQWLVPSIRTIIDGGGQDCKVIRVNKKGEATGFRMNDKCGAGTGRSLQIMSEALGIDVSELGPVSLRAKDPVIFQDPCCILTEMDIRSLILDGRDIADIAAGINDITARWILHLARNIGIRKEVAITGGIAHNAGVVRRLEQALETEFVRFPEEPRIIGAIGAAIFAAEEARKLARRGRKPGRRQKIPAAIPKKPFSPA